MTNWALVVRVAVGVVGLLVFLGALVVLPAIGLPAVWGVVTGGALIVAALFEVGRYRAGVGKATNGARFQSTDEVFVDPTTGARTRVWFDPRSGERRYEPEP